MIVDKAVSNPLDDWAAGILADPRTKESVPPSFFSQVNGRLDARVYLQNTHGFSTWRSGQEEYESGITAGSREDYDREIEAARPIYEHIRMSGRILDVGGGAGIVREYLPPGVEFISVDPFIDCLDRIAPNKMRSYRCLSDHLNFIAAAAEFLPFKGNVFDWVHMRSMIDHLQAPDLAMIEAHRVLKSDGRVVVGLYVEGGKSGQTSLYRTARASVRGALGSLGLKRFQDHHVWHPTYAELRQLIETNGFEIEDAYWQPAYSDTVVYITARKR